MTPARHSVECDCIFCQRSKKHPQVKPHHALCGCFECTSEVRTKERTCPACIGTNGNHERGCYLAPPSSNLDVLKPLLERLRTDGGRYLLSVGLTREERDAQPEPTFGGKGHVRWLTDEEYAALCSLSSPVETTAPVWKRMRDQVPANGTWIWWDYGKGPMLQRAQDFASEDDGYWIEATPPLRSPEEPPEGYPGIAHDYEKLRYVLSQVRDHSTDDWAKGIAREAVGPQRELSPSEAASFTKTLARSPRRVESMPSEKASEVRCGLCGETKTHGPKCGYAGSPVGQ